ncbi:MAG: hypothetical protein WCE63_06415 [Acidobacteriaceae bacterium]
MQYLISLSLSVDDTASFAQSHPIYHRDHRRSSRYHVDYMIEAGNLMMFQRAGTGVIIARI